MKDIKKFQSYQRIISKIQNIREWKNEEALDIHHKSEMMREIADLRNKYQISMKVEKFKSLEGEE